MTGCYAKTDYDGCPYITAGKRYEIRRLIGDEVFMILDDEGVTICCGFKNSLHIQSNDWKIGIIREGA